jgi:hypothetical protein
MIDRDEVAKVLGRELTARGEWAAGLRYIRVVDGIDYPHRCYDADGEIQGKEECAGEASEADDDPTTGVGVVRADLDDDATGGVLFGMLGSGWVVTVSGGECRVARWAHDVVFIGTTLAEAASRALLAGWGVSE